MRILRAGALLLLFGAVPGCGYTFHDSAFRRKDVRSICLEMFGNDSFRRELEFPLTEAVKDRILHLTPYTIETRDRADSVLRGRITRARERVITEDRLDRITESSIGFTVRVEWIDLRSRQPLVEAFEISSTSPFVLILGETRAGAQQEAFGDIADEIVRRMEISWDQNEEGKPLEGPPAPRG